MTEGSFSMAMIFSHRRRGQTLSNYRDPANMSMSTLLAAKQTQPCLLLFYCSLLAEDRSEGNQAYFATGSGVTPNQASSVMRMPSL